MPRGTANVGVIICSTRKPRAGPQIVDFVVDTIKSTASLRGGNGVEPALTIIDLQERNLPMFDESDVPSQIFDHHKYDHAHTRAWSAEVQSYDGFIFVVPQYNWGYPAPIKNAIDFLYNEWKGKPAMIVSYGGRGGGRCNAQLREVLCGVRMLPTTKTVELAMPSRDYLIKAARGRDMGLDGTSDKGVWNGQRKNISAAYAELLELMSANKVQKAFKSSRVFMGLAKEKFFGKRPQETAHLT